MNVSQLIAWCRQHCTGEETVVVPGPKAHTQNPLSRNHLSLTYDGQTHLLEIGE